VIRILAILSQYPTDMADGYSLRVYNILKQLDLKNSVFVIVKNNNLSCNKSVRQKSTIGKLIANNFGQIESHPIIAPATFACLDKRFLQFVDYDYNFHKLISQKVLEVRPDVVITFGIHNSPYLIGLQSVVTICDIVDDPLANVNKRLYNFSYISQHLKNMSWVFWAYYRILRKCNILLAVTEEDSRSIKFFSRHRNVYTLCNGVTLKSFNREVESDKPVILFSGNMDFPPNVEAVRFFVENIWERIKKRFLEAEFWIVGRNPVPLVKELSIKYDGVRVTGFVDDIRSYISKSWVVIAPMINGAGIKNKVLEAWAMGKPVVATKLASRGLSSNDGSNILIANSRDEFYKKVCVLLDNKLLRYQIGEKARRHVSMNFTWDATAQQLIDILRFQGAQD